MTVDGHGQHVVHNVLLPYTVCTSSTSTFALVVGVSRIEIENGNEEEDRERDNSRIK